MNTLQSCCAGPKHRMTIWKPLGVSEKLTCTPPGPKPHVFELFFRLENLERVTEMFQGSVDRWNWVEVENYWIINGGQQNKSKNWWTPMTKHEKWMEMVQKIDEIWMNNGWQWMKLGKHWCRKEKKMKHGWKLDGNGNIELRRSKLARSPKSRIIFFYRFFMIFLWIQFMFFFYELNLLVYFIYVFFMIFPMISTWFPAKTSQN